MNNTNKGTIPDRAARKRIIDAATKLFSIAPVGMTTINTVAREAGVKQPLLMYHFKTKDRLYQEVLMKAAGELYTGLQTFFDEFNRRDAFSPEEARELLSGIVRALVDSMYTTRENGGAWLRIILFEICFPSQFFQELYVTFLSRFYVMVTGLIMSINNRYDYETAVLQWMQIFGLIVSHKVERETVKRFTGFKGENAKEREKLKDLIVRNTFLLLEVQ